MYRLLIVDNERMIVNGLVEFFNNQTAWEMDVYGAYSVAEALSWLKRAKIDVVVSDVRMPVMNGLELQKEIVKQWPRCKVIFLSGYNDFEYIQEAARNGSVDYLLKTEDNATILEAVGRAFEKLAEEGRTTQLVMEARLQMQTALPILRKEYLTDLLQGDPYALQQRKLRFADLQIGLDDELPVFLLAGRIDEWAAELSTYDKSLYRYALQNIAAENLQQLAKVVCIETDRSGMLWFLQPLEPHERADAEWERLIRYAHGIMEQIQSSFSQYFRHSISLVADSKSITWEGASVRYEHIRRQLRNGTSMAMGRLMIASAELPAMEVNAVEVYGRLKTALKRAELFIEMMENGDLNECLVEIEGIMGTDVKGASNESHMRMQLYYALASTFLQYLYRSGLYDKLGVEFDLYKAPASFGDSSWDSYTSYCKQMVGLILERQRQGDDRREHELIRQVNKLVEEHLHEDLSLVRIGEAVGLNSFYLSRLYKHLSGKGLKEHISQVRLHRAKELLRHQEGKIGDVALALGFLTETYFYRFFKKMMNMTPQEYRDSFK